MYVNDVKKQSQVVHIPGQTLFNLVVNDSLNEYDYY